MSRSVTSRRHLLIGACSAVAAGGVFDRLAACELVRPEFAASHAAVQAKISAFLSAQTAYDEALDELRVKGLPPDRPARLSGIYAFSRSAFLRRETNWLAWTAMQDFQTIQPITRREARMQRQTALAGAPVTAYWRAENHRRYIICSIDECPMCQHRAM